MAFQGKLRTIQRLNSPYWAVAKNRQRHATALSLQIAIVFQRKIQTTGNLNPLHLAATLSRWLDTDTTCRRAIPQFAVAFQRKMQTAGKLNLSRLPAALRPDGWTPTATLPYSGKSRWYLSENHKL